MSTFLSLRQRKIIEPPITRLRPRNMLHRRLWRREIRQVPKFERIGVAEGEDEGVDVENGEKEESQGEEKKEAQEDGWFIPVRLAPLLMPDPILIVLLAL